AKTKDAARGIAIVIENRTMTRPRTCKTGSSLRMTGRSGSEEGRRDLEEFLHLRNQPLVRHEHDDVVVGFDDGIVVGHQDFLMAHDGAYRRTGRQVDVLDA